MQSVVPNQDSKKVELFFACRNLLDLDAFSKSDPYVAFLMKDIVTGNFKEMGRTEIIKDNLNPNFAQSIIVDYVFQVNQICRLEVRDYDEQTYEDLGIVETSVGTLVGARNQTSILDLMVKKKGKKSGKIIVRVEPVEESRDFFFMKWSGKQLKNVDGWFDKSDPFLRFNRIRQDQSFILVHETEHLMDNLNPIWKPFQISGQQLMNGDINKVIKVECWDWEKSGKPQFIGECLFTMDEIINKERKTFQLVDQKQKESGTLVLEQFSIQTRPTFLDYIRGGVQLSLILAVDFTGSNGAPNTPSSLHYFNPVNPNVMNAYQNTILSVGTILLNYDFDKRVPSYGFGAMVKYPNLRSNVVQHCFPMSGDINNPQATGLEEIMNVYSYALKSVDLSGPTYFAPIIKETLKVCQVCQSQGSVNYNILLILTDGAIHDMDATIDLIVSASDLPVSIIIVGIGNADFTSMETLDGDSGLVNSQGRKATRDIVQFVPFRNVNNNPYLLAKEVLAQIPAQVCQYYRTAGILPRPPNVIDINAMKIDMSVRQGVVPPGPPPPNPNIPPPGNYYQPPPAPPGPPSNYYQAPAPPAPPGASIYTPAPNSNNYGTSVYTPPPSNNMGYSNAPPSNYNNLQPPPQQQQQGQLSQSVNPNQQKESSAPPNPLLGSHY